jgi:hypothetical protein
MSFTVVLRNVSDKRLGTVMRRLGADSKSAEITYDGPPADEKQTVELKLYRRVNPDATLSLGPNDARENSQIWHAKAALERLEARHGVGEVTRYMLTEHLKKPRSKVDAAGSTISSALKHGLITANRSN